MAAPEIDQPGLRVIFTCLFPPNTSHFCRRRPCTRHLANSPSIVNCVASLLGAMSVFLTCFSCAYPYQAWTGCRAGCLVVPPLLREGCPNPCRRLSVAALVPLIFGAAASCTWRLAPPAVSQKHNMFTNRRLLKGRLTAPELRAGHGRTPPPLIDIQQGSA